MRCRPPLRRRDQRRDKRPVFIRQLAWISQTRPPLNPAGFIHILPAHLFLWRGADSQRIRQLSGRAPKASYASINVRIVAIGRNSRRLSPMNEINPYLR